MSETGFGRLARGRDRFRRTEIANPNSALNKRRVELRIYETREPIEDVLDSEKDPDEPTIRRFIV